MAAERARQATQLRVGLALNTPLEGSVLDPVCEQAARDAAALVESLGHSRLVTLTHRDCEITAWLRGGCQLLTEPDIMAAEKTVMVHLQLEKGRLFDRVSGAALVGCATG